MITGEERLREYVADLYGDVSQYEGRPTEEQFARADVMGHQLDEVVAAFNKLAASELPGINSKLKAKHLPPIDILSERDWQKASAETGSANAAVAMRSRHLDND